MMARTVALVSAGFLVVGFAGGLALPDTRVSFLLYHVGGLGAQGLLACAAAVIAGKKGYGFWRAFSLTLSLPVLLGVIAAFLVPPAEGQGRPAACGGSVSLAIALIIILLWTFAKRRGKVERDEC